MTCEQFFDYIADEFDTLFDEMYWNNDYSSKHCFNYLKKRSHLLGVELIDEFSFDYADFFWEVFQHTEKGLS